MLFLTVQIGRSLQIGDVQLKVCKANPGKVWLGLEAPSQVKILRAELAPVADERADEAEARHN